MPYVDIFSKSDYASIWYITNSRFGNVGGFDPAKPTVMMLHPSFTDSSWLSQQFGDARLDNNFNLIAVDMRVSGKSVSTPTGWHDNWVEAADLAFVYQALRLPPAHVFAHEGISANCALRFASLFPDMCLSLTLANVPPPTELKAIYHAYDEMLQQFCFAKDLDTYEHVQMEVANLVLGSDCDPSLRDDLICYWASVYPPFQRQRILEMENVILNRTPLSPQVYNTITQPVLIVQAERSQIFPLHYAEKLSEELVNAKGGAIVYPVKGALASLCVVPSTASITNKVFANFVSRLPPTRSDIVPPATTTRERMQRALQQLAELMNRPEIATRDPLCSLSFSCLKPEVIQSQTEGLKTYGQGIFKAFCPLRKDGKPLRRYSERFDNHWFASDVDGLSYAESSLVDIAKCRQGVVTEPPDKAVSMSQLPKTEPIPPEAAQDGRLRRTFSETTADKFVLVDKAHAHNTSVLSFRLSTHSTS